MGLSGDELGAFRKVRNVLGVVEIKSKSIDKEIAVAVQDIQVIS